MVLAPVSAFWVLVACIVVFLIGLLELELRVVDDGPWRRVMAVVDVVLMVVSMLGMMFALVMLG